MTIANCKCGEKLASVWSRIGNDMKKTNLLYCRKCNKFFKHDIKEYDVNVLEGGTHE